MRRGGLRGHIRHQRRLARLMSRHVLVRRAQTAVRMLDALGAWSWDEEPAGQVRFVPPLNEMEAVRRSTEDVVGVETPLHLIDDRQSFDADVPAVSEEYVAEPAVSASEPHRVESTRGQAAEPARVPNAPPRAAVAPTRTPPRSAPDTAPASTQRVPANPPQSPRRADVPAKVVAQRDRSPLEPSARRLASPNSVTRTTRSVEPLVRREEPLATSSQAGRSPRAPDIEIPIDTRTDDTLETATNRDVRAIDEPTSIVAGGSRSDVQPTAAPTTPGSNSDQGVANADKTAHDEIVARALGALRASGELPAAKRQPSAAHPGRSGNAAAATSHSVVEASASANDAPRPQTVVPRSRVSAAAQTDKSQTEPEPVDRQAAPSNESLPREETSEIEAHATTAEPTSAQSSDAPSSDQSDNPPSSDAARAEGAALESATTQASAIPSESSVDTRPRVDEQRQARRPAHWTKPQHADAPTPPSTNPQAPSAPRGATSSADRGPRNDGQFQFVETGRTLKEWGRLLMEATTPQSAARRKPRAGEGETQRAPLGEPAPAQPKAQEAAALPASRSAAPVPRASQVPTPPRPGPAPRGTERVAAPAPNAVAAPRVRTPGQRPSSAAGPSAALPERAVETITRASDAPRTASVNEPESGRPIPTRDQSTSSSSITARESHDQTDAGGAVAEELRELPSSPVSPSTRRFLRPLVGVDPETVRIHRGERAAALAAQHGADAIAVGDDIAVGAGHDERDPATSALIAHELTHSARARDPRFVPPAARRASGPGAATRKPSTPSRGTASADEEEAIAEAVETRVHSAAARERDRAARAGAASSAVESTDADDVEGSAPEEIAVDRPVARSADAPATAASSTSSRPAPWGSLPAPWEPLPAALVANRAPVIASDRESVIASSATIPSTNGSSERPADAASVVHRAERGGGSRGEEPSHAEAPAEGEKGPDIDALARQVYSVLKRRLAAESRRGA